MLRFMPKNDIRDVGSTADLVLVFFVHLVQLVQLVHGFVSKGLAAQSKAEAIGWNKISSANQRPGFQMIFYTCQSARHMIMQLWFAV